MAESVLVTEEDSRQNVRVTFEQARSAHQSVVFAFVSRRIKPVQDAEDVTAEVFVEAFSHWRKCKGPPKFWLLGIARRKVANHYRKKGGLLVAFQSEVEPHGDLLAEFEAAHMSRQALKILERLRPSERDALLMQVLEQMSIAEIASVLGRSHAGANSLLERAKQKIRGYIEEPKLHGENQ